ncbi:hypothetical protein PFISCL1PPCAC_3832, partial [Pristionchus fissidentatus]
LQRLRQWKDSDTKRGERRTTSRRENTVSALVSRCRREWSTRRSTSYWRQNYSSRRTSSLNCSNRRTTFSSFCSHTSASRLRITAFTSSKPSIRADPDASPSRCPAPSPCTRPPRPTA